MINGKIILPDYHFERLFKGMQLLQIEKPLQFTSAHITNCIYTLCKKNDHTQSARIRLNIFRGKGGLYDAENHKPNFIIESWKIKDERKLNSNGLTVDIYPDAKKSCDVFSNVKSNNFLPYAMGALYAKKNKLNDAILLNTHNRICDSTIANIFIIKNKTIYTPLLTEGCIAGVTRRWLLENLSPSLYKIKETEISIADLQSAEEIFFSNAVFDIRWVKQFQEYQYSLLLL